MVFINDLPDKEEIFCDIGIFADDTSVYKCSEGRPGDFEQAELAGSLELDLARFLEWGSDWRVSFNALKTKLLSIHRSRNVDFPQILMGRGNLPEAASFRLLGLTFSNDLTWTNYITSVAKSASMKVGSLFRARGFLTHDAILHIYKSVIRPSMEYCCHIWAGASARALGLLDRIQRRIVNLVGPALASQLHSLSHRRDVASLSLFYKYFHKQCSKELSALVPPPKTFHRRTRLATRSHRFTVVPRNVLTPSMQTASSLVLPLSGMLSLRLVSRMSMIFSLSRRKSIGISFLLEFSSLSCNSWPLKWLFTALPGVNLE